MDQTIRTKAPKERSLHFPLLTDRIALPTLSSVVDNLRLADGTLWSMPINLDVSQEDIDRLSLKPAQRVVLRDPRNDSPIAVLTIQDIYTPDKVKEAKLVFGDDDLAHPAVKYLHQSVKEFYVGGTLQAIQAPVHYDYVAYRSKDQPQISDCQQAVDSQSVCLPPNILLFS